MKEEQAKEERQESKRQQQPHRKTCAHVCSQQQQHGTARNFVIKTHYNEQGRAEVIRSKTSSDDSNLSVAQWAAARGDEGYQGRNHEATARGSDKFERSSQHLCNVEWNLKPEHEGKLIENDPTFVVTTSQQSAETRQA